MVMPMVSVKHYAVYKKDALYLVTCACGLVSLLVLIYAHSLQSDVTSGTCKSACLWTHLNIL